MSFKVTFFSGLTIELDDKDLPTTIFIGHEAKNTEDVNYIFNSINGFFKKNNIQELNTNNLKAHIVIEIKQKIGILCWLAGVVLTKEPDDILKINAENKQVLKTELITHLEGLESNSAHKDLKDLIETSLTKLYWYNPSNRKSYESLSEFRKSELPLMKKSKSFDDLSESLDKFVNKQQLTKKSERDQSVKNNNKFETTKHYSRPQASLDQTSTYFDSDSINGMLSFEAKHLRQSNDNSTARTTIIKSDPNTPDSSNYTNTIEKPLTNNTNSTKIFTEPKNILELTSCKLAETNQDIQSNISDSEESAANLLDRHFKELLTGRPSIVGTTFYSIKNDRTYTFKSEAEKEMSLSKYLDPIQYGVYQKIKVWKNQHFNNNTEKLNQTLSSTQVLSIIQFDYANLQNYPGLNRRSQNFYQSHSNLPEYYRAIDLLKEIQKSYLNNMEAKPGFFNQIFKGGHTIEITKKTANEAIKIEKIWITNTAMAIHDLIDKAIYFEITPDQAINDIYSVVSKSLKQNNRNRTDSSMGLYMATKQIIEEQWIKVAPENNNHVTAGTDLQYKKC